MDGDEVAAEFGLGQVTGDLVEMARGGGGHNVVYRLDTTIGRWAVKVLARELDDLTVERFEIELAASGAGVPMPQPVPTAAGAVYAHIGGGLARCHEWVDGVAKANEDTTVDEAGLMGELVGRLHSLSLAWSPRFDQQMVGGDEVSWSELAAAGAERGASWANDLAANMPAVERLTASARRLREQTTRLERIGSHRDLNAHNVLFDRAGLALIDWDAAGPVFAPWERANFATLWSVRHGGHHDLDAAIAFLRGYERVGGDVLAEDSQTLEYILEDVESWTKKNVRWAVRSPSEAQDHRAALEITALLSAPAIIDERRRLLDEAVNKLSSV